MSDAVVRCCRIMDAKHSFRRRWEMPSSKLYPSSLPSA